MASRLLPTGSSERPFGAPADLNLSRASRIRWIMLAMTQLAAAPPIPAPADTDDNALVRSAVAGSQAAFEQLYRRHVRRVYGAIWRLLGGAEARAQELTQDAFVRAWQALPGFRGDSAFGTWLYRLAINTALMDLRARAGGAAEEIGEDALTLHAAPTSAVGLGIDLTALVAGLPPRARAVLVLFDIEGWSHEEIAERLGMAVGSSKAQLHRARGLLRHRLGGES